MSLDFNRGPVGLTSQLTNKPKDTLAFMKTAHLITTIFFLAVLSPAFADRRMNPVDYHGSAVRVHQDGSIACKNSPYLSPAKASAPLRAAYQKLRSPSADCCSKESGFGRFLYRVLCPTEWGLGGGTSAEEADPGN